MDFSTIKYTIKQIYHSWWSYSKVNNKYTKCNIRGFLYYNTTHHYVKVGIVLTAGKHLHDIFITLTGEVWAQRRELRHIFIAVPVPRQENWTAIYMCISGIDCCLCFHDFGDWILELYRQCHIFGISFYFKYLFQNIIYLIVIKYNSVTGWIWSVFYLCFVVLFWK
jgi:hypothetical protein